MDGFKQTDNIIVIGATNIEKALDPAIKRPGRFDKIIHVPLPDVKGRQDILTYYLKKIKFAPNVDKDLLARRTTGFSGADIQTMVNVAILNAVKSSTNILYFRPRYGDRRGFRTCIRPYSYGCW
jgi:ATP-dependent metalloprotease